MLRKLFDRQEQTLQMIWTDDDIARPQDSVLLDSGSPASRHLMLRKRPYEVRMQVVPGAEVQVGYQTIASPDQYDTKAGIVWVRFLARDGSELPSRGGISKGPNGHYIYIVPNALGRGKAILRIPQGCHEARLGFALWKAYPGSLSLVNAISVEHNVLQPFPGSSLRSDELQTRRVVLTSDHEPASKLQLTADRKSVV